MLLWNDFFLNFQWIHWSEMTLLYLNFEVWGVTDSAFSISGSNCSHTAVLCHFPCFFAQLSPPANIIFKYTLGACIPFVFSWDEMTMVSWVEGGDNWAKKHGKWHRTTVCEQLLPEIGKAQSVTPQTTKYKYRTVISDQYQVINFWFYPRILHKRGR